MKPRMFVLLLSFFAAGSMAQGKSENSGGVPQAIVDLQSQIDALKDQVDALESSSPSVAGSSYKTVFRLGTQVVFSFPFRVEVEQGRSSLITFNDDGTGTWDIVECGRHVMNDSLKTEPLTISEVDCAQFGPDFTYTQIGNDIEVTMLVDSTDTVVIPMFADSEGDTIISSGAVLQTDTLDSGAERTISSTFIRIGVRVE